MYDDEEAAEEHKEGCRTERRPCMPGGATVCCDAGGGIIGGGDSAGRGCQGA